MPINTKKVSGRRSLYYSSYGDLLADAEQMASAPHKTLGNWTLGQVLKHNAQSIDSSIDGARFSLPAPIQWLMSLFMKRRFLTKPLPAGFKTTAAFTPPATSVEEGLAALRKAIERRTSETKVALHPGFGKFSRDEWDAFNLRHAEMHMSFINVEGTGGD